MKHSPVPTPFLGSLEYSLRKHLILIGALVIALLVKNAPLFLAGQFVSEDSFYFYATAYNLPLVESLTTPYAGYLLVLPMLLAELLWNVPFEFLPWINSLTALCISTALLSWLYTPHCRNLIQSDGLRLACVIILAFTPFQPNLGMLLGLHWYLAYFLGIFLLCELPKRRFAITASCCFVVLAAWSTPASIVLIPVACYRWWMLRKDVTRHIPLCFAAASIAYVIAILFAFKPASSQQHMAALSTAVLASFKMLHEGILLQSILGVKLGTTLPNPLTAIIKLSIGAVLASAFWRGRKEATTQRAAVLLCVGLCMLGLTMLRGHQSRLILEANGLHSERYLTTPSFYIWAVIFTLAAPYINRATSTTKAPQLWLYTASLGGLFLLIYGAPPLSGKTPIEQAFPHQAKADALAAYERKFELSGQGETLALPGWTPIESMRLKIGGGRICKQPTELSCIFGNELQQIDEQHYRVDWLGEFERIDDDWIEHESWGRIAVIGYDEGFYWFQAPDGQQYLSGPAIYPKRFEYPIKGAIRIPRNN